jgi:hypothetical protein
MMDIHAHHALRCPCAGDRIARHNHIRDFLFNCARRALYNPLKEPLHLLSDLSRPADVAIPNYAQGKILACDVAVIDPLQQAVVQQSSMTTGAAAEKYANIVKNTKYSVLAREAGVLFKPIVVESLGAHRHAFSLQSAAEWPTESLVVPPYRVPSSSTNH